MNYLNKKTVEDIEVTGKKVLVRCDFNVPFDGEGNISDPKRIDEALKTIKYLVDKKAKVNCYSNSMLRSYLTMAARHTIKANGIYFDYYNRMIAAGKCYGVDKRGKMAGEKSELQEGYPGFALYTGKISCRGITE